jgi:glycosyltransferase involved in cell wall biosynthesis
LRSADAALVETRLVVVDNGSTDGTPSALAEIAAHDHRVFVVKESRPGSAAAKNVGIASLNAGAILFTDDDVLVPVEWVQCMSTPLLSGAVHAVAGATHLAPGLASEKMGPFHFELLADTGTGLGNPPRTLIGASMGVSNLVVSKGFRFDEHLGPGALGFMEESLLHNQILEAGGSAIFLEDVVATHCVDVSRLDRQAWIKRAAMQGRCEAWLMHHWEHLRPTPSEKYIWVRSTSRLGLSALGGREKGIPSERELQRVRRVATGRWWLHHGRDQKLYERPKWYPGPLG